MKSHHHFGANFIETELGKYYICDKCGKKFVSLRRKVFNLWIAQRFFQGRGCAYTGWFMGLSQAIQTGGIAFLFIKAATGWLPPIWLIAVLWLSQATFETWTGYKDYKHWKLAQNEGLYGFNYSPMAVEQLKRQRNIEKVSCEIAKFLMKKEFPYQKDSVVDLLKQ